MQSNRIFGEEQGWSTLEQDQQMMFTWHGTRLHQPDWSSASRTLAFSLGNPKSGEYLHVMINAYWEALSFQLPPLDVGEHWSRIVDTALEPPNDYCERGRHQIVTTDDYLVSDHSVVILLAHRESA